MVSKAPHLLVEAVAALPAGSVAVDIYGAPAAYHGDDSYTRSIRPGSMVGLFRHDFEKSPRLFRLICLPIHLT